jgi:hypothetical protein
MKILHVVINFVTSTLTLTISRIFHQKSSATEKENNYKNATVQPNFRMKSEIFPSPQYYPNYKDGSFPLLMRTTTKKGQVKGILDPIGSNPKKRANAVQSMFKSTKACFFESAAIILPNESLSVAAATAVPLPSRIQLEEGTK